MEFSSVIAMRDLRAITRARYKQRPFRRVQMAKSIPLFTARTFPPRAARTN